MASIDEMLFDALRRSNPIGRVIDDFKRAQPALQAAQAAPTGAVEALIGKLMVSPAFRTSATEEEARRRALEQDDLFVKALLGFEQAQGNPIQRAMAANEAGAAGREIEQGVYNMFLDPTNLIPVPTGKANKVLQATRKQETLAKLMEGTTLAGMIEEAAVAGGKDSAGDVAEKALVDLGGNLGLGPQIPPDDWTKLGSRVRSIAGNQNDSLLDFIAQNGLENKPYNPVVENKALQDIIEGVRAKPKRIDYVPYSPESVISPGRQSTFEDAIRMNREELLGSIPDYGRGADNPAIAEALRTPAIPPPAGRSLAAVLDAPKTGAVDAFMQTPRVIKPFDLAGYEAEKAAIAAADARLAEMRRLRDSPGAIQEALPGSKPQGVQYEMFPDELNTASKQPKLASQVTKLAEDTPVQMGLVEDLANSVGDAGTKYDRFVGRLTAITKKEGEVPPMGSSFWAEPRGGNFTPDEVRRFFARAREEGILGKNLDAVLPEPNLSNVDIPNLGEEVATPRSLAEGPKKLLELQAQAAYGEKSGRARLAKVVKREGLRYAKDGNLVTSDGTVVTEEVLRYLDERIDVSDDAAGAVRGTLRERLAQKANQAGLGSSVNFTSPGMNAAINLGMKALATPVLGPALTGGVAVGGAGAVTGGIAGALATPEDRWGGAVKGAAGGAVLGGMLGTGTSAYGLRHVNRKTATNLMKHSWALARKDVVATTEASQGRSILPTPSQFVSLWKNQTVSTLRQFGQDGTWSRLVMDLLQGRDSTKLLPEITEQISDRMMLGEYERLSTPLQEILEQSGMKGYQPKLGMPMVESVAMHGLSRSKSVVGSALLSTFGPGNLLGGIAGALKGAALPEFSGAIRHGNGALNRSFRETAFWDERNNKLIPLAIDAFKRLGYDLSNVPIDQLTRARVTQMYGAKVGAMWEKTAQNMVHMSESRVRYLFGDYTPGQKGAIGIIEKITGPGMPLSSWAIRAYPVALDMAIQNPWVALGVYQFLQATAGQAGKDGRPRWTAGKLPISTEFPLLGAGARTLLGGQKGTAYVDPVGSLSPVGGDLFQPGADQEGPQSLYQQISEIIGRAGLPGLSPMLQGIAYMLGLDYKGPGNMSRTQGMENSLGLIPGNVDLPGWGDVALRAGRAKLSPAFAGTEIGAKLGATGDKYPTVYDPVARRYGELVVKATQKSLDDPANRAYLYDLAAGTGELYDQARREVLLGGLARNAFSTTSPIGVATQGEDARQVRRDREGVPVPYELISAAREQGTPQQVAQLSRLNAEYKVAEPWAAAYDVGSKSEAESMLMEDALRRYTFRGVQYRPSSPAQLQRVVQAGKERAEGNRIPPKK